ncbi:NAD(P)/FAD-dependent oxidoreductase [Saccharopolyspora sp. HNM0983]|uniref:NAD(P)/FAD-dependent oxidoreductase n=1 Tax=Saccharopolyspora montiporae TaxID=2781240 RepID=A0A929B5N3_9PSEU|nr:NAD(P)/FAD-dependent oxidoreductase [Saccharopolyspora sp. HNM0983]MBE9373609.1 NAD(P)/FAD-dependent oxidoreductase [Saccharopolyspora sp. HNM0983]
MDDVDTGPELLGPEELGFDPQVLRDRYRAERDRRLRPDGATQYIAPTGDFGYYVDDPYVTTGRDRAPLTDDVDVLVVGAGFGGLLAGARLRLAGVDSIRVVEKAGDVGGTWYWNRYPGVRCDIESYIYLPLLEEVGSVPEEKYARGDDIRKHAQAIAETFGLYRDACFQTEVTGMDWDEPAQRWRVTTDQGDAMTARYVIFSAGPFSRPKLPGIPGIDDFRGHTFHTSRWDYAYTGGDQTGGMHRLADKRVAVIGTGATAIQCVPALAQDAAHLYVFQRTPSAVDERGNRPTDPDWLRSLEPGWHRARRDNFLAVVDGQTTADDSVVDRWADPTRHLRDLLRELGDPSLSEQQRFRARELADFRKMNQIRDRVDAVVEDPDTAEALKPWYRYDCKRPTFSDEYLPAFNRPNVSLVDTGGRGVERITEHSLVSGGTEYEVDCIIFATGFEVGRTHPAFAGPRVHGRDGRPIAEHFRGGARTLHGFTSHGFPNLFCMGPSQNGVAVNFAHVLDDQAAHIAEVIAAAEKHGSGCVEPTAEAEQAWVDRIRREAPEMTVLAECTPGYLNNEGRPPARRETYAGNALDFAELLRRWRAGDGLSDVLAD